MEFLAGPLAVLFIMLIVIAKVMVIGLPLLFLALVAWAGICWAEHELSRVNASDENSTNPADNDDDSSDDQNPE